MDTNQKIAALLFEQTYDERIEMAKYIAGAAMDWAAENKLESIDSDYFASLLGSWAEENAEPE